jgi:hypothetical protein
MYEKIHSPPHSIVDYVHEDAMGGKMDDYLRVQNEEKPTSFGVTKECVTSQKKWGLGYLL